MLMFVHCAGRVTASRQHPLGATAHTMITLGQNTECYAEFGMTKAVAYDGQEWETCLLVPNCKRQRDPSSCALVLLLVMVVAAVVLVGACCTCAVPRQGVRSVLTGVYASCRLHLPGRRRDRRHRESCRPR